MALNPKSCLVRRKAVQYFLQHGVWPLPAKSTKIPSPQKERSNEPDVAPSSATEPHESNPEEPHATVSGDIDEEVFREEERAPSVQDIQSSEESSDHSPRYSRIPRYMTLSSYTESYKPRKKSRSRSRSRHRDKKSKKRHGRSYSRSKSRSPKRKHRRRRHSSSSSSSSSSRSPAKRGKHRQSLDLQAFASKLEESMQ